MTTLLPTPSRSDDGTVTIANVIMKGAVPNWRATAEDLGNQLLLKEGERAELRQLLTNANDTLTSVLDEAAKLQRETRIAQVMLNRARLLLGSLKRRWFWSLVPRAFQNEAANIISPVD